ncbi:MAG: GNAT family N-acetyltransferase, partial [Chloroflexota bacterium]|nr:GNAT family N-acetyltransferase [Chloroflexota bacterium]
LAVDGEEIAGISLCKPKMAEDPEMGYVSSLAVLRRWRRQGIALALLQHTFGEFFRRGTRKVSLDVDAGSLTGALRLYEKAGMHVMRQSTNYEKELRPGEELSTQSLAV